MRECLNENAFLMKHFYHLEENDLKKKNNSVT